MADFVGFGDRRRAKALGRLEEAMVSQSSAVVRRLGGTRAGEMSAHRVLSAPPVTAEGIVTNLAERTARTAAGRRVVVAQDTTEVNFPGHTRKRLGRAGRLGKTPGFFIHGAVAIDREREKPFWVWRTRRSGRAAALPRRTGTSVLWRRRNPTAGCGWPI